MPQGPAICRGLHLRRVVPELHQGGVIMAFTDLVPWGRNRSVAAPRSAQESSPLFALHREMNRMFDDFARSFDLEMPARVTSGTWPRVEINDSENEVKIV